MKGDSSRMSQQKQKRKRRSGQSAPQRKLGRAFLWVFIALGGMLSLGLAGFLVASLANGGDIVSGVKVTPEVTGAPRLKADQDTIDLGDIKLGRTVSAEFTLTNVGDRPLQVTEKPFIEVLEGC
jgi:hypothetical protein